MAVEHIEKRVIYDNLALLEEVICWLRESGHYFTEICLISAELYNIAALLLFVEDTGVRLQCQKVKVTSGYSLIIEASIIKITAMQLDSEVVEMLSSVVPTHGQIAFAQIWAKIDAISSLAEHAIIDNFLANR